MPVIKILPSAVLAAMLCLAAGCSSSGPKASAGSVDPPVLGACRTLTPAQVEKPSNPTASHTCATGHTAETFMVGTFPDTLTDAAYDDPRLGTYVYATCGPAYVRFLGGSTSMALRSLFSWGWFRPSPDAWAEQARWYRCDLLGGPGGATSYRALPQTAKSFLGGRPPQEWVTCATGRTLAGAPRVPCAEEHDWRAVTTIKLGAADDAYPGDRLAEIRSREFCSDSVGAWLDYPTTDYDYGVTVFHEAEWTTGNRLSVCWARTAT